jgi:uncharacterized 2Fe-2S/4Fe-4S cluster protein (DUF4445 family)
MYHIKLSESIFGNILENSELKKQFYENVNNFTSLNMSIENEYKPEYINEIFLNTKNEELNFKNLFGKFLFNL